MYLRCEKACLGVQMCIKGPEGAFKSVKAGLVVLRGIEGWGGVLKNVKVY